MNKKLMAVAVAGALAAPAAVFAQASSVQIYGRLNAGIDQYQDKGASTPGSNGGGLANRTRIFDSSSRLGFRGTEDLGNGLKAIFLIESGFMPQNGVTFGRGEAARLPEAFGKPAFVLTERSHGNLRPPCTITNIRAGIAPRIWMVVRPFHGKI